MEHLIDLGVFAAKTFMIITGLLVIISTLFFFASRGRQDRRHLEVEKLNDQLRAFRHILQSHLLEKKAFKTFIKSEKSERKAKGKSKTKDQHATHSPRPHVYVLDFDGDLRAAAVDHLRQEITAVLSVAQSHDEVVIRLDSPGGMVNGYGLGAAQIQRIRDRGIPVTVCIDKIAASGGYMMACVATRIIAAPFAIVGSVGVVAAFANFHRILEKHDVDYHEITAGEFKRTVSLFGEITPQGYEKFKEQIQDTHVLFKSFVQGNRPQLDVEKIANGEYWYGTRALELKLVDQLQTSDDYLVQKAETADVLRIRYHARKKLLERVSESLGDSAHRLMQKSIRDVFLARFGL